MLNTWFDSSIKYVLEQPHVIKQNWKTFAAVSFAVAFIIALTMHLIYSTQISNWQSQTASEQSHSKSLQDRIDNLQQNQITAAPTPPSQWRRLKDAQRDRLLEAFKQPDKEINTLVIYAMADSESRQYASQFVDVAKLAGIDVRPREVPLNIPVDVGVMIGLFPWLQPNLPLSGGAKRLKQILDYAGIESHYTRWTKEPGDDSYVDFDLFIGPKPW